MRAALPYHVDTACRAAAYSVGETPRGVLGRVRMRSGVPDRAAAASITTAATIRDAGGQCTASAVAPWPPVVPPSVDTRASPRSRGRLVSTFESSTRIPVPARSAGVPPSRCTITATIWRDRPGR